MKKLLALFLSCSLASLLHAIPAGLTSISFATSQAQFAVGDAITITEVLASSTALAPGDTVVVHGTYTLASRTTASLSISLTTDGTGGAAPPALPTSTQTIARGSGTFELEYAIAQVGTLHVSFYAGASFGGIYFASSTAATPTTPSTTTPTTPVTPVTPTGPVVTVPTINTSGLASVPFATSQAKFEAGDALTITDVLASSPAMQPGDTVLVRGSYVLQSHTSALLLISLTANAPGFTESTSPSSRQTINAGSGTFEVAYEIKQPGALHVSLYPTGAGGSSFGGVYFAAPGATTGSTGSTVAISNPAANTGKLGNLSIRSLVGPGEGTLVAGLTIADQERYVLIRGIGPSLNAFGISSFLRKPTLTVYNAAGDVVATAGSWSAAFTGNQRTGITLLMSAVGAFPLTAGSDDAVLNLRLVPGAYTVMVSTGDGQSGVALLEIYASPTYSLPPPQ